MTLRLGSTLPTSTEALVAQTIDCAMQVHRRLGPGFLESVYVSAMCVELKHAGVTFERERMVTIEYRGDVIGSHRLDLIVGGEVVVELKATSRLEPIFQAKLISYLRATRLRVGLLINFNAPVLKEGLKRIVV
jgi:GxxExxY protein